MPNEKENTTFQQKIWEVIPEDVLEDVPEHKLVEFRRGVLLYLSKEAPGLYRELQQEGELCGELRNQTEEQICKFAGLVKKKKRNGGIYNA